MLHSKDVRSHIAHRGDPTDASQLHCCEEKGRWRPEGETINERALLQKELPPAESDVRKDQPYDQHFMNLALAHAKEAFTIGEVPVGAVIVLEENLIATGFNRREIDQDSTAHAELIVIREASSRLGTWRLNDTTLYVTLEPCAMCAGAIIQARVARLVFGAFDPKAGACGSVCSLLAEPRFNHRVTVDSGLLAEECGTLLQNFFQQLRQANTVCPN